MKTHIRAGAHAAPTFSRYMRSLGADNQRRTLLGLLVAFVVLGAWGAWLFLARVTLYEVTSEARLEAEQAGYTVEAAAAGRVVNTRLTLGQEVKAGDVLAELDTDEQQHRLEEERTRLAGVAPQIDALAREVASEQQAVEDSRQANRLALEEARARVREVESAAQFKEEEARRLAGLFKEGVIAEMEVLRVRSESRSKRAEVESLQHSVTKLERQQRTEETERRVRIDKLLREKTELEGQRTTTAATISRLQNEIERRTIRAPASGQLGEVTTSKEGSVVSAGDKLGTVVPSAGALKIVAEFPPSALGRVHVGQGARMRLASFPWTQYGSLNAVVTRIAGEARDGKIRVELSVRADSSSTIPLQHGLPGVVEIEVEQVSPATLLLRTVKLLTNPSTREGQAPRSAG
ncbi:MAG TPA: HlyD family efflux transporter periplasmic adaptor subunit [Pyrinomonadaceae bacterium]